MSYERFRLQIVTTEGGGYAVQALSPEGEGAASFVPPVSSQEIEALNAALWRTKPSGRHFSLYEPCMSEEPKQSPEIIGEKLFEALFQGEVLRLYERSVELLETDSSAGLRLELTLDPRDRGLAALQALPWELLRQPGTPNFLALSRRQPLVRFFAIPRPVYAAPRPRRLNILAFAGTCRHGMSSLNIDREMCNLWDAVGSTKDLKLVTSKAATLAALRKALLAEDCHVLHIMGHGGTLEGQTESVLFFETEAGELDPVTGTRLLNTIGDRASLKLVVLNACDSAGQGSAPSVIAPFAALASSLLLGGIPAVIAMQAPISDTAAIAFSCAFYQSFLARDPIDAAVTEGRQAIHAHAQTGMEWAAPVLLMRTPTGELFPANNIPGPLEAPLGALMHEQIINLRGRWIGSWKNLEKLTEGEEAIEVVSQTAAGIIEGHFLDLPNQSVEMQFKGEFHYGKLSVGYWAPPGQNVMQDGCCYLKLGDDGILRGYYADFSGCGTYELKLDQPR